MTRCMPLLLWIVAAGALAAPPEEVTFPSGKLELHGFLFRPEGSGPFPAILYNHGSEEKPGPKPELGRLFSGSGYVFFVPHRRGHGRSPRDATVNALYAQGTGGVVTLHELHLEDQLAALAFLKRLDGVDPERIAVAGCSYGGIQTVLAVEVNALRGLGLRAAVDFAGGAQTWRNSFQLRQRMLDAIGKATIPVMFVQAQNDYDTGPSYALGKVLEKAGKPHKVSIYPPYGTSVREGHGEFCSRGGASVWGADVLAFLAESMKR
jgi:dienelactone hydrolase